MKKAYVISSISEQLSKTADRIRVIASDIEGPVREEASIESMYTELILDNLEQIQKLTLALTETVSESIYESEANADDTAFGPGELDYHGKEIENPKVKEE